LSAIGATAFAGALLGLPVALGAAFGALSMLGDLVSSFLKRRAGVKSSNSVLGLDQIPEAALPTTCLAGSLGLGLWGVIIASLGFMVAGIGLSKISQNR
jgi:CDP-2,3-bis-(O-geranylgeranyl)-sn-glycerol synthase